MKTTRKRVFLRQMDRVVPWRELEALFDAVLGQIFGYERMANYKALTRLLDKFDQASIVRTFPGLYRHLFEQVGPQQTWAPQPPPAHGLRSPRPRARA